MAVPSLSPSSSKDALREHGLAERRRFARSLAPELRAALETQLAEIVLPHLMTARTVAAYHPLRDEISPYGIVERLGASQAWALPWFAGRDARMIWRSGPAAEASPWGVLQPAADAPAVAPDTVLVPIVLADRRGTRLGHGKGHYDRGLAHLRESGPVFAIGLCWESQLVDFPIPADPWDVPLDAIATPREWISTR